MNCIKVLTDEDFGIKPKIFRKPRIRLGARGIIFNSEHKIAILYKKMKNEYKLIGGGVEASEEPMETFKREALEEAGCVIKIITSLGTIEEHKSQDNFKQTSFVYLAQVVENKNELHLTEQEIGEGSEVLWVDLEEAIDLIKNSENNILPSKFEENMSVYHTKFIVRRDYEILKYYQKQEMT